MPFMKIQRLDTTVLVAPGPREEQNGICDPPGTMPMHSRPFSQRMRWSQP